MSIEIGNWLDDDTKAPTATEPCGLFVTNSSTAVPLRYRAVTASVYAEHSFCEVTEALSYVSDEDCTARFVFPLPPRSAVFK